MPVLVGLAVAIVLPEAVMQGADLGLWGSARWRPFVYQNAGFWAGLLDGWTPNYPGQPILMFVTYGFLHAGLMHLIVNLATLLSFGQGIVARVGQGRFAALYAVSLLGGGIGFGLLSDAVRPMVGCSGALFGLVGAWIVWAVLDAWDDSARPADRLWLIGRGLVWPSLVLVLLNVAMLWLTGGLLAWEAHLGGFVAGLAVAPALDRPAGISPSA